MDIVEDIKGRLSIEEVVEDYVPLKRSGRNFKGLSPFNSEKTPSFIVSPEKQIWHDFSSNKGGDMFSFVMDIEGLDFKQAIELLARKAGLDLNLYSNSKNSSNVDKKVLYRINEHAAKFYQVQLKANPKALNYILKDRQLTKKTILDWRLGYSPNTGTALVNYLKKCGFSTTDILKAGLVTNRYDKHVDIFRGRLMIPLQDPQGEVIGFTARAIDKSDTGPKYINTPQTVLYDKSRHIFGLHLAKAEIRTKNFVVIVEGNLDVISSYQAGSLNVVATAGTALTAMHLKAVSKFTDDVRLCLDNDRAGLEATERAINISLKEHLPLNIISLDQAKDPDELIKKDPHLWESAINSYKYFIDWMIDRYLSIYDIKIGQGKKLFSDKIIPLVNSLDDPVEKDHYLNVLSNLLGVKSSSILTKSDTIDKKTSNLKKYKQSHIQAKQNNQDKTQTKYEDHLLAILLMKPNLRKYALNISQEMFVGVDNQQLYLSLRSENKQIKLEIDGNYVKILELQYEELYMNQNDSDLIAEIGILCSNVIHSFVRRQKYEISKQLANADSAQTDDLLSQVSRLDQLLK